MRQDFSKIPNEELGILFPISLETHNPSWKTAYEKEKRELESFIEAKYIERINHIGSTFVPNLLAKPTVDILLEVTKTFPLEEIKGRLLEKGYVENNPEGDLVMFIKGYTPQGFRGQTYHIHIRYKDDWGELYFRDYLYLHPEIANKYATLKRKLKEKYQNERDLYTQAKGEFVSHYTNLARREFPGKYL